MDRKNTIINRFSLRNVMLFSFFLLGLTILDLYRFNYIKHDFVQLKV